jgi:hypothetical protein
MKIITYAEDANKRAEHGMGVEQLTRAMNETPIWTASSSSTRHGPLSPSTVWRAWLDVRYLPGVTIERTLSATRISQAEITITRARCRIPISGPW